MAEDVVEQLKSREVCECEADLRAVARHEILRGRALIKAVRGFLIEIEDGALCMKDEAPKLRRLRASEDRIAPEIDQDAASAAVEFNDQIRQRVDEIKQIIENGGG